jgi:hypothetical protein
VVVVDVPAPGLVVVGKLAGGVEVVELVDAPGLLGLLVVVVAVGVTGGVTGAGFGISVFTDVVVALVVFLFLVFEGSGFTVVLALGVLTATGETGLVSTLVAGADSIFLGAGVVVTGAFSEERPQLVRPKTMVNRERKMSLVGFMIIF